MNSNEQLQEELKDNIGRKGQIQANIYPRKTVWASSSGTNIILTVDVANSNYIVNKVAVNQVSVCQ